MLRIVFRARNERRLQADAELFLDGQFSILPEDWHYVLTTNDPQARVKIDNHTDWTVIAMEKA